MQIIMNQYVCFIAIWCLVINTYIVFSFSKVKTLENKEKKRLSNIIYFITAAMMICDLDTYMFVSNSTRSVYWNLKVVNYSLYLLKYLYLTVFTIYIMKECSCTVEKHKAKQG